MRPANLPMQQITVSQSIFLLKEMFFLTNVVPQCGDILPNCLMQLSWAECTRLTSIWNTDTYFFLI